MKFVAYGRTNVYRLLLWFGAINVVLGDNGVGKGSREKCFWDERMEDRAVFVLSCSCARGCL
jgi:hypothetical protein